VIAARAAVDKAAEAARLKERRMDRIEQERRQALREALELIARKMTDGCGDTCCRIRKTGGQGTNGGCRCGIHHVAGELRWIANEIGAYEEAARKDCSSSGQDSGFHSLFQRMDDIRRARRAGKLGR